MNIRCERCGELIWYDEDSAKWLYCRHCGKSVEKPEKVENIRNKRKEE